MRNKITQICRRTAAFLAAAVLITTLILPLGVFASYKQKTVRVGYVNAASYEMVREDGYKSGSGYEYLQKISYITGWKYEYVCGSFSECYEKLLNGEIDLFGNVSYTPERAKLFDYSSYPQGKEDYWLYTNKTHENLADGRLNQLNGCTIGVTEGSYQAGVLRNWLDTNSIKARIMYLGGDKEIKAALEQGKVEACVGSELSTITSYVPIINIGSSEYYFAVSKTRPDLLSELNEALGYINRSEYDYNGGLARRYNQMVEITELTAEEKEWLNKRNNTLRLGLLSNNLPYSAENEDGSADGILIKLAESMKKELDINVELKFYSGTREMMNGLEYGEIDAMGPMYGDFYLAEQYDRVLTDEIVSASLVIVYQDKPFDAESGTLAVSNDTLLTEKVVQTVFPKAKILTCKDLKDCTNAVIKGKADGLIVSSIRLNLLRQYPVARDMQFVDLPNKASVCLATTKEGRIAAEIFNKGITLSSHVLNGGLLAQSSYVQPRVTFAEFVRGNLGVFLICTTSLILILVVMAWLLFRKEKQSNAALKKAQAASAAKSDFLSRMSHDIRTPMNAIINLTNMALKTDDINAVHEYLDMVSVSGKFLLGLINDILDMSKIESGKLTLNKEPLSSAEFLNTVDTIIRPMIDAKRINYHEELELDEYIIMVDKLRFNQILFNLLSNAVKFTPEGGDIWFKAHNLPLENGRLPICFTIRDNGIGMSEEFLGHLFETFAQEHSALSNKTKGTGLGLPIVKSLVEAMNGRITVKSKLGEGTEFVVVLYADIADKTKEFTQKPTAKKIHLDGLKILLAEDNDINVYVAQLILEEVGCVVTVAKNGREAVDMFKESEPFSFGAILMDIRMPLMDGLEATKTIRLLDRPDAAEIPIIAMTADAFAEERKRTIDAGMNLHLSKPIEPEQLYEALEKCIAKQSEK